MPTYRCRQGCFSSDPDFRCEHGGGKGKPIEPVLKGGGGLYLDVHDPVVDHPANVYNRHVQETIAKNEKHWKEGLAKAKRNQEAWAEEVIQRSDDFSFCPVLPVVRRQ